MRIGWKLKATGILLYAIWLACVIKYGVVAIIGGMAIIILAALATQIYFMIRRK